MRVEQEVEAGDVKMMIKYALWWDRRQDREIDVVTGCLGNDFSGVTVELSGRVLRVDALEIVADTDPSALEQGQGERRGALGEGVQPPAWKTSGEPGEDREGGSGRHTGMFAQESINSTGTSVHICYAFSERTETLSTTEQLAEILQRVLEVTESLGGDEHRLREIAFEKLLEHELNHASASNTPEPPKAEKRSSDEEVDTSLATPQMRADAVSRYFKIRPEEAIDLFDLSEEAPELQIPSHKLDSSTAGAVREIALLVCGARTALGIETGSRHIREAASEYKKVDANFNKHLTDFDLIAVRGKPRSPNRLVRMRVIGAEAARELAQQLVSNGA